MMADFVERLNDNDSYSLVMDLEKMVIIYKYNLKNIFTAIVGYYSSQALTGHFHSN